MKTRDYIIKRVLLVIPTLLGVSFIIFYFTFNLPGGPAELLLRLEQADIDPEVVFQIKKALGLDKPWYIQYFYWLKEFIHGSLGISITSGMPIYVEIVSRIPNTLSYQVAALVLSTGIAIPAGVTCAVKQNTRTDSYIMMGALAGVSFPLFFTGLMLMYIFSLFLGWFPSVSSHSTEFLGDDIPRNLSYYLDYVKHMVLPTMTLTLATVGYTTRMVRSAMLNVLREDYVMTARSKGLKERTVIYKHALKNAIPPVITVIGLRAAVMLGGAPLIEFIYAWPGLGMYFINAVRDVNYYAITGATLFLCFLIVISNLLVDLSYVWLDPRVKL